ncbi:MAG: phosphate ABC transporter permease subunit PstC [Clostridiales bacterium]|nr:phosphate ABC transporter permease subunit PstC [Clostridiales bacterium]
MKKDIRIKKFYEKTVETWFLLCAIIAILFLGIISIYLFLEGTPAIFKIGLKEFILGSKWMTSAEIFGIFPMIIASIYGTLGAIVLGVPIGIFTAIFMAEIAPEPIVKIVRPAIELLAGIPSVIYGFFGLIVIVPIIDNIFGNGGNSLLAAIIILGIMILPTIVNISESAIREVPKSYKEGSLALGASQIQTIFRVILPAARSGILAGVVLGIGRAIGETMAVILVAGNTPLLPESITDRVRTMTSNIALEMSYAFGLHQEALFATGVILFIFIILINVALHLLVFRSEK